MRLRGVALTDSAVRRMLSPRRAITSSTMAAEHVRAVALHRLDRLPPRSRLAHREALPLQVEAKDLQELHQVIGNEDVSGLGHCSIPFVCRIASGHHWITTAFCPVTGCGTVRHARVLLSYTQLLLK